MKEKIKPVMVLLSQVFYERNAENKEILAKQNRPYLVLLLEYRGLKFAIPFRSNIQHSHAYKFQGDGSQRTSSGLDFSKSVLIMNEDEIGVPAHLISAERKELLKRFNFIVEKFHDYIDDFIEGLRKEPLQPKYRMSSLTYYRDILLESKKED